MAQEGDVLEGPNGFRLRLVSISEDVLEMEATYAGDGQLPPEHLHPNQAERFEVLEGTVRAIIDGDERRYATGEAFAVPPGTRHQMAAEEPTRMRWEVRPALRTAEFFEQLYGVILAGKGGPDAFGRLLDEYGAEFRLTG